MSGTTWRHNSGNVVIGIVAVGRYSGSNENFVLVRTGITAVLSFELPVFSEDGNRFTQNSPLMTHNARAAKPALHAADIKVAALA